MTEAQKRYQETFDRMQQVGIENSMKGRMTLEAATAFFNEHQAERLETSLRRMHGI